ncbi:MAG: UbiX family flavin prenyltransferase [Nitrospirae bacterium]|nr:UbiX family flavin prenyltransferase [Nitrospirota bacterium]MBI3393582.1 UbiX family flavin prenyltransferase [Nitrospirota bacterium]
MRDKGRYVVALTGASGSAYGIALLRELLAAGHEVHFAASKAGKSVLAHETGLDLPADGKGMREALGRHLTGVSAETLHAYAEDDFFAPIASGSFRLDGAIVVPCSMKTVSALAHGASGNLIERAGDVALKEKWPLVVVPRETPLSEIHLSNLLTLARAGARIVPAMPGFYHHPARIEDMVRFVVARVLDVLGLPPEDAKRWGMP